MSSYYDVLTVLCKNMNMPDGAANVIFNDAKSKFWDFYRAYEDEYRAKEMQPPDVGPTFHTSPAKSAIAVLQALRNTMHSGSSSSSSTPSSQSAEVRKTLNTTWVEMTEIDFDILCDERNINQHFPFGPAFPEISFQYPFPLSHQSPHLALVVVFSRTDKCRWSTILSRWLCLSKNWDQETRQM